MGGRGGLRQNKSDGFRSIHIKQLYCQTSKGFSPTDFLRTAAAREIPACPRLSGLRRPAKNPLRWTKPASRVDGSGGPCQV